MTRTMAAMVTMIAKTVKTPVSKMITAIVMSQTYMMMCMEVIWVP
jgi:hypothetical protein